MALRIPLIALLTISGTCQAAATLTVAPLAPGLAGITILLSSDPGFQAAAQSIALKRRQQLNPEATPWEYVIRNDTGRAILALNIVATTGVDATAASGYSAHSSFVMPGNTPELAPGQLNLYAAGVSPYRNQPDASINRALAALNSAKQVTVSVDSVMFADGTFVGPDLLGQFALITAQLNAQLTIVQGILSYRSSTVEKLQEYLTSFPKPNPQQDPAERFVNSLANSYQRRLAKVGAAELFAGALLTAQGAEGFTVHR